MKRPTPWTVRGLAAAIGMIVLLAAGSGMAQQSSFVINLRNTDIKAFAEQVSEITDRTLILDPAVAGQVTVLSSTPLDADGVWQLFQSVLRVYGYAALQTGAVWRVVPQTGVKQGAVIDRPGAAGTQDFVTRLVRLEYLPAEEAVRVLRPLVASFGFLEALQRPNSIVITDTVENVRRLAELAAALDQEPGEETAAIKLRFAGARELGQAISEILSESSARVPKVAVDERSNTLLLRGEPYLIDEFRSLARSLDTPGGIAPTTRVFRLKNNDAESIAEILRGLLGGGTAANPVARALEPSRVRSGQRDQAPIGLSSSSQVTLGRATAGAGEVGVGALRSARFQGSGGGTGVSAADGIVASNVSASDVSIQAAVELNAIVARGPPAAIAEIDQLIRELDVRRPQVMIEAAIVEITGDAAEQLGIQFGIGNTAPAASGGFAATSFALTGASLQTILGVLGVPAAAALSPGFTGAFTIGDEFGVLVQALAQSSRANLLSTPSLTTLDNEPAEIVVAQNVPFLTGSFTSSGDPGDLFSTIEREDVGITLRVVPRVHEGNVIRLEVSQEASSLANANVPGAVDLVVNRRLIQTTVLADDGGTIVLGGLITDNRSSADSRVPILGDIPVLGRLFSAETQTRSKQTLFVFLRPTILRDRSSITGAAEVKYDRLRQAQNEPLTRGSLLLEGPVRTLPLEIEGIY